jgi:hypothetical protein
VNHLKFQKTYFYVSASWLKTYITRHHETNACFFIVTYVCPSSFFITALLQVAQMLLRIVGQLCVFSQLPFCRKHYIPPSSEPNILTAKVSEAVVHTGLRTEWKGSHVMFLSIDITPCEYPSMLCIKTIKLWNHNVGNSFMF